MPETSNAAPGPGGVAVSAWNGRHRITTTEHIDRQLSDVQSTLEAALAASQRSEHGAARLRLADAITDLRVLRLSLSRVLA